MDAKEESLCTVTTLFWVCIAIMFVMDGHLTK